MKNTNLLFLGKMDAEMAEIDPLMIDPDVDDVL